MFVQLPKITFSVSEDITGKDKISRVKTLHGQKARTVLEIDNGAKVLRLVTL